MRVVLLTLIIAFTPAGFRQAQAITEQPGIRILHAELDFRPGKGYVLNADIDNRLSETAIEALRNGVPLTLQLHLRIRREGAWWWESGLIEEWRQFGIRYHSLIKLYQLTQQETGQTSNFASLNALLERLGAMRELPVLTHLRLDAGQRYRAKLAMQLDLESLPLPLRPFAYFNAEWTLSSPWYRWSFAG